MPTLKGYADFLGDALKPGFDVHELVKHGSARLMMPPEHYWPNIVDTLLLANELRYRMVELGAKGLRVNAAYRPKGGAPNSAHRTNRALDLDLLPGDYGLSGAYYLEAVKLWCRRGVEREMGLGLYCARGRTSGIRVHIDTGYKLRTWQNVPSIKPPAARVIAKREGLVLPNEQDEHPP